MRTITALWLLCVVYNIETVSAAAPTFDVPPSNGGSGSIAENKAVGSVIITLQATDSDGDQLTFTVASQTPAIPNFNINGNDELEVPSGLDYETTKVFTFTLSVTDGPNTVTTTYTLTITDVDDESPVFSQNKYIATIVDSASAGTTVTTVTATDADSSSFIYSIQGAQTTFAISTTGVITVSNPSGLSGLGGFVTLNIQANDTTNAPGMATVDITIQASPCKSNPCQNGGTCTVTGNRYSCACLSGYTGATCNSVDRCIGNPCQYGAKCVSGNTTYTCACLFCQDGRNCTDIDKNETCSGLGSCDPEKAKCKCPLTNDKRCKADVAIIASVSCVGVVGTSVFGIISIAGCIKWRKLTTDEKKCTTVPKHMKTMLTCQKGKSGAKIENGNSTTGKSLDSQNMNNEGTQDNNHGENAEQLELRKKGERSKRKKKRKNKKTSDISGDEIRESPFIILPGSVKSSRLEPIDVGKPPMDHSSPRKLPPIPTEKKV